MLNLDDNLTPQEIMEQIKTYGAAHGLKDLWWELHPALYRALDGHLVYIHWPSSDTSTLHHFATRPKAEAYLKKHPEDGNVLVHVIELDWAKELYQMARSETSERLRLYERGNDACPICLRSFTSSSVEKGETVTLQSVSLGGETLPICLACTSCAASPGRDTAVQLLKHTKATLEVAGIQHNAYLKVGNDGSITAEIPRESVPPDSFRKAIVKGAPLKVTVYGRPKHSTNVAWLKTAYLSVFSLLGVHGYRYASGKAVELVRQQLMDPERQVIREFTFRNDSMKTFGMLMNQRGIPCWAVIMQECVVVLPAGWDESFYDRMLEVWPDGKGELGGGPLWYPAKFGEVVGGKIAFKEGVDVEKVTGGNLFGKRGRVEKDGVTTEFVIADWSGQAITTLNAGGLQDSDAE